jgi:hypothetical protein
VGWPPHSAAVRSVLGSFQVHPDRVPALVGVGIFLEYILIGVAALIAIGLAIAVFSNSRSRLRWALGAGGVMLLAPAWEYFAAGWWDVMKLFVPDHSGVYTYLSLTWAGQGALTLLLLAGVPLALLGAGVVIAGPE